jgi:hypothetical protein
MCFYSSLVTSYYWLFSHIFYSMVTCERVFTLFPYHPSPAQSSKSLGTSPLGLTTQNRKNHPIEVTLGGIGSCYANLSLYLLTYYHKYKLCDNILAPLLGNTESILLRCQIFSVSLSLEPYPTSLLGDSISLFSLFP